MKKLYIFFIVLFLAVIPLYAQETKSSDDNLSDDNLEDYFQKGNFVFTILFGTLEGFEFVTNLHYIFFTDYLYEIGMLISQLIGLEVGYQKIKNDYGKYVNNYFLSINYLIYYHYYPKTFFIINGLGLSIFYCYSFISENNCLNFGFSLFYGFSLVLKKNLSLVFKRNYTYSFSMMDYIEFFDLGISFSF